MLVAHKSSAIHLLLALAVMALFVSAPVMAAGKIDINTASVEELQSLPKIGPKTAEAIVKYRQKHPFKSIDELINVKGIGEKKLELLRPLITVGDKSKAKGHH
jgi:competence protein ComEA